jgi:hypothetical protein
MLIDIARDRRLKVMTGITLRENVRMIELARTHGFTVTTENEDPTLSRMTKSL